MLMIIVSCNSKNQGSVLFESCRNQAISKLCIQSKTIKPFMKSTSTKPAFLDKRPLKTLQHSSSSKLIHQVNSLPSIKTRTQEISILTSQIDQQSKQYQWRQKTQLPIVKIIKYELLSSQDLETKISVELQSYPLTLSHLKELPLFKILYLLKETIIGFERLVDKMGFFAVSPSMIVLSQKYQCKVWYNQNLASNKLTKLFISQKNFLDQVFGFFEVRANKLRNCLNFFSELKRIQTFCQALSFIQNYARENKINIGSSCKINESQRINKTSDLESKAFDATMTMSKAPKFLKNSNIKLTLSPSNHRLFDIVRKNCAIQDQKQTQTKGNEKMKASDNTAADIHGSNTTILVHSDQISQRLPWKLHKQTHSNLQPKTNSTFSREYSNNEQNYEIHCKTPTIAISQWEGSHKLMSNKGFLNEQSSDEESNPEKIKELFNTNSWSMNMKGLFVDDSPLRSSFVQGKQTRKTEYDGNKLHLLGSIGKEMIQSQISQEFDI